MSTWESEMTPEEWEGLRWLRSLMQMGIPYSHISPEEGEANRKLNKEYKMKESWTKDKVQQVLDLVSVNWKAIAKEWCTCPYNTGSYSFNVPPNKHCPLCKTTIDNDHYHCGACSKITQVG